MRRFIENRNLASAVLSAAAGLTAFYRMPFQDQDALLQLVLLQRSYLYYGINNAATGVASFSPSVVGTSTVYSWSRDTIQVFRLAGSYRF